METFSEKWALRFLDLANTVSKWSKDKHTQVGCVIIDSETSKRILSIGYNGLPQGVDDSIEERYERPLKYFYMEHAERNAIFSAAKNGVKLENAVCIVNHFPCVDCTRALIQAGIKKLYTSLPDTDHLKYAEQHSHSLSLLKEANLEVKFFVNE